ncbi:hypothetical protein BS47DRAFT_1357471 [Hydnum rufescens UP504]|uniref:Uncharacterized protein n=1 Tax=Hydnum rufescens UP504 TaxID=1448309 RepID=A0A9P6BAC7_9AGAM|nr:hypothetical protein BS47DRAFT_1357471 [Hydnum rufescens UP504]
MCFGLPLFLLNETLKSNILHLPEDVTGKLHLIANKQWNEMINDGPTDAYLTGFTLDFKYHDAVVLAQPPNPITSGSIQLPPTGTAKPFPIPTICPLTLKRIGTFLVSVTQEAEITMGKNPDLADMDPNAAIGVLTKQIHAYLQKEYSFEKKLADGESTLNWWTCLKDNHQSKVIASITSDLIEQTQIAQWCALSNRVITGDTVGDVDDPSYDSGSNPGTSSILGGRDVLDAASVANLSSPLPQDLLAKVPTGTSVLGKQTVNTDREVTRVGPNAVCKLLGLLPELNVWKDDDDDDMTEEQGWKYIDWELHPTFQVQV